jgi:pseudoazurin
VAPGDTVKFVLVDKNHNAEAITEVWPEGVEPLKGEMNQDAEFVVEKPGFYGIKCHPHFTMGMVALIVAGEPTNKAQLDAFKAPGGAKKRWDELVKQITP